MKKVLAIVLILALSSMVFAGCGNNGGDQAGSSTSEKVEDNDTATSDDTAKEDTETSKETTSDAANEEVSGKVSDEPVTFTFFNVFAGMPFDSEWEVWKEIEKETNVKLEGLVSLSTTEEETAYNMMLSSGDLADIISYKDIAELEKLGQDGGLIPLNDLIDEYAPNIKAFFESNPDYRKGATALDGNIYFIPKFDNFPVSQVYWIRKDWLDKLDLEVPETLDQLQEVLTAFKEGDPNGNGLADEVPYFDRDTTWFFDNVLYMWDASTDWYARDSKITFGPLEEEFAYGIREASQWYADGLIDPEIFTRGGKARDTLLGGNLGGMTHDWVGSTSNYNSKLESEIEGFELVPMMPVANQKGDVVNRTYRYPIIPGWGISTQCEDPITAIKFFDFFFGQVGHNLMNFGIEGNSYNLVDGNVVYTEKITGAEGTPLSALRSMGVQYRIGMVQDFAYEKAQVSDIANIAYDMYSNGGFINNPVPSISGSLNLRYTEDEAAEYQRIMANIDSYVDENVQKWVLGAGDFETEYDMFVEELKNRGIQRAIEINQAAYERFLNN